jgi:hypothetical protein
MLLKCNIVPHRTNNRYVKALKFGRILAGYVQFINAGFGGKSAVFLNRIFFYMKNPGKYMAFLPVCGLLALQVAAQDVDTLLPQEVPAVRTIRIARDAGLESEVQYGSLDSMYFDVQGKRVHLWGQAFVRYQSLDIQAGYILLDYANDEVLAEPFPNAAGEPEGIPSFKDATQAFQAQRVRYNFKTGKGKIDQIRTKQEDMFVLSESAKIIGKGKDTTKNDVFFNKNALITTCDAEHPHFGIRSAKQKVIPDKLVVTGLSHLEVAGVPTPLLLPFGFYPVTKSRKAGLIIPRDFEFADQEGLGIKQWGWYQPINQHMDLTAQFDAYVSGRFGVRTTGRYARRYGYTGRIELEYNRRIQESFNAQKISTNAFGIRVAHDQDPKAHPTRRFGGTVNLQSNNNQSLNNNDFNNVFQNTLYSNLNYSQTFPGKPYQFNAGFSHSQNTQSRAIEVSFPTATFTVQRIFPFKRKEVLGKELWYEKITFNLESALRNSMRGTDTTFFSEQTLRTARVGIQHRASTDLNFKLFKYINVTPRMSYEENWYPYSIRRELTDDIRYRYDTIRDPENPDIIIDIAVDSARTQWGVDTTYREWGFSPFRTFDAGVSAGTALFLTRQYKKGWLRGIRHTMKPNISTGFGPDFSNPRYDYFRTVRTDLRPGVGDSVVYSIFDDAIFGRPTAQRRDVNLNYSLLNILEIKHRSKKDTIVGVRKMRIFDNLTFSGSYSLTRDTLRWTPISTGGLFRLFKGVSQITWNASFDPYTRNEQGVRINTYALRAEGKLVRLANAGIALNTNFSVGQLRGLLQGKALTPPQPPPGGYKDLLGWLEEFRISHRIGWNLQQIGGSAKDTFLLTTNNISFSGRIPLSDKWAMDIGNVSYDFPTKRIVYPDLGLTRDLHCWQISLRWQPVRGTYEVFINAKPGTLDFLKVPYRKNNFDGRTNFQ